MLLDKIVADIRHDLLKSLDKLDDCTQGLVNIKQITKDQSNSFNELKDIMESFVRVQQDVEIRMRKLEYAIDTTKAYKRGQEIGKLILGEE